MRINILGLLLVFILGAGGGMWAQAVLLPYMASQSGFQDMQFIKDWNARTLVVSPVSEIVVNEGEALVSSFERTKNVSVAVQSVLGTRVIVGSGLIITSDGLIITLASVVPSGYVTNVYLNEDSDVVLARVLKRDLLNNLALLKIENGGLPTRGFGNGNDTKLGSRVFLSGFIFAEGEPQRIIDQGIITATGESVFQTTMDRSATTGFPVFDIEGKVLGLGFNKGERVSVFSASLLREFLGF